LSGPLNSHGEPSFETEFSWRDLILIAGGLFLLWKATKEIHHTLDPVPSDDMLDKKHPVSTNFAAAIVQILLLDIVFSLDSVITAVGMAEDVAVMILAVVIAVGVMLLSAGAISAFVERHPTVKMLALSFLLLIGMSLIGEGWSVAAAHYPADRAFPTDRCNLDGSAIVQLDHQRDHGRSEREIAPFDVSPAILDMVADREFNDACVGLKEAADVRRECGEQQVARKGSVEPVKLVDGVGHAQLTPCDRLRRADHYACETGFNRG
jgi:hypothetical protein